MRRLLLALGLVPWFAWGADRVASSTLRIIAWTTGDHTLSAGDLKVEADGKPTKVLRVRGPGDDLLILVVLDLTGDLTAADQAKQSLVTRLQSLPPTTWVGTLRAQDGMQVLSDPGADRGPSIAAVQALQVAGRAGMLEVLEPIEKLAEGILKKTPIRMAILFVTDSSIYNYREDYTNPVINPSDSRDLSRRFPENLIREKTAKLAEHLGTFSAPIFVAHVAYSGDRLNEAYQNGLRRIAEATGGAAWFARVPTEIGNVIDQAFDRVQRHWAIDVELPPKMPRNFTVQVQGPGIDPQYRSRYGGHGN